MARETGYTCGRDGSLQPRVCSIDLGGLRGGDGNLCSVLQTGFSNTVSDITRTADDEDMSTSELVVLLLGSHGR